MKVLMVAPLPPPYGGIANWTALLDNYASGVPDVELTHINIAPKKRDLDGRSLWDRVVVQGFAMLGHKRELKRKLKSEKPDVIHMTTSGQLAVIRDIMLLKQAKKMGVPTVYHLHFGRIPEISKANTREWKMIRRAMQLATHVIAIDNKTLKAVSGCVPGINVSYVPNPFDLSKIEKLNISGDTGDLSKNITFVGWVIKTKGVEELLEAWENVHSEYPDWKLNIIGPYSQEYHDELCSRYSTDGVCFCGEKNNAEALQRVYESEIFVLPSYTEGFPNVILEAMALKRAIIATDVGAIPDMLDGCGITIPKENADAIADALRRLISDDALRAELGHKAKEKMLDEYVVEKVFDEYKSIWLNIQARK